MCGIFAAISASPRPTCRWADRAVGLLAHRGPDDQGTDSITLSWGQVDLGMARLRIVDQNPLRIPFRFPHLQITLVYNGELYNYQELRNQLPGPWATSCDAEVIAAGWRTWGLKCFSHFNGMWGLVLVDHLQNLVVACRDRAGEKGLYLSRENDRLYIASEAKALPGELKGCSCSTVNAYEFDTIGPTPLAGISTLPPGELLFLDSGSAVEACKSTKWWQFPDWDPSPRSAKDLLEEGHWLVQDAIKARVPEDLSYAVAISGGLDSALIQAVAPTEHTFCVTFPQIDNISVAALASQGFPPQAVTFGPRDLLETLPKVAYHLDTPATWTACCQWFLQQAIHNTGIRVALTGEGADELFYGYSRYRILYWLTKMHMDVHLEAYAPTIQYLFGEEEELGIKLLCRGKSAEGVEQVRSDLRKYGAGAPTLIDAVARTEFYTTMQVLLRMADRMSGAFGIETRSPFLDYRLLEFSCKVPLHLKINGFESKALLRDTAVRVGVAQEIIGEKTKKGLFIPWQDWKSELCGSWVEGRGKWDRSDFSRLMTRAWREAVHRPAQCTRCTDTGVTREPLHKVVSSL